MFSRREWKVIALTLKEYLPEYNFNVHGSKYGGRILVLKRMTLAIIIYDQKSYLVATKGTYSLSDPDCFENLACDIIACVEAKVSASFALE